MLSFSPNSFTVEVYTGNTPHDNWRMTCVDIIEALQATGSEMRGGNNFYYLLELLRYLIPDENEIKNLGYK